MYADGPFTDKDARTRWFCPSLYREILILKIQASQAHFSRNSNLAVATKGDGRNMGYFFQFGSSYSRWARRWAVAIMGVSILLSAGCATTDLHGVAQINSIPAGAEVINLDDDTSLGVTPVNVWWQEGGKGRKFVTVRFQKNGYIDKTTSFWLSLRHSSRKKAEDDPQEVLVELEKEAKTQ